VIREFQGPDSLFDLRIADHQETPSLHILLSLVNPGAADRLRAATRLYAG
jgi:hypothetical protein